MGETDEQMDDVCDRGAGALGSCGGASEGGNEIYLDGAFDRPVRAGVHSGGDCDCHDRAGELAYFGQGLGSGDWVWRVDWHRRARIVRGLSRWEGVDRD